jgi:Arc/MetJ family transcription regulator
MEVAMPRLVRKNVFVDPTSLRRAQRILGVATESQAIREALDLVAFRAEVMRRYDRVAGKAPRFRDPWATR